MRALLLNRATIVLGLIALVVACWNVYVVQNDDGILEGRVVLPNGEPAAGARVAALSPKMVGLEEVAAVQADGAGHFRFVKHNEHRPIVQARLPGVGKSEPLAVRLHFRNQNRTLTTPLVLRPE